MIHGTKKNPRFYTGFRNVKNVRKTDPPLRDKGAIGVYNLCSAFFFRFFRTRFPALKIA